MTAPYLIPCLVELRSEFNAENPDRDKSSDGWIGDAAHQKEQSDHNPDSQGRVLAIDIDSTGPWPRDNTLDVYVAFIVDRCQNGVENRLEYIIRNRVIYTRTNGFKGETYTGSDPHTNHAHFSARHDHTGQSSTVSWELEEVGMPTAQDIANALLGTKITLADGSSTSVGGALATILARTANGVIGADVWGYQLQDPQSTTDPQATKSAGAFQRYIEVVVQNAADDVVTRVLAGEQPPTN